MRASLYERHALALVPERVAEGAPGTVLALLLGLRQVTCPLAKTGTRRTVNEARPDELSPDGPLWALMLTSL